MSERAVTMTFLFVAFICSTAWAIGFWLALVAILRIVATGH